MSRALRIVLIAFAAFALFQWWSGQRDAATGTAAGHADLSVSAGSPSGYPTFLPPEAIGTLRAIDRGGPFPYPRDGVVFQNRERRLPDQPRGYYHEYTVPTPGEDDRGARRIVTGGNPPVVHYYTDDHYQSFRQVETRP